MFELFASGLFNGTNIAENSVSNTYFFQNTNFVIIAVSVIFASALIGLITGLLIGREINR